jgi:AICAR transformylase/IMP cyclohydrolase PurH
MGLNAIFDPFIFKGCMPDLIPVKRALVSVSDKTGLAVFASALHKEFGVELISTGGTAKFLRNLGLPVTDVSAVTGFPEMMDGRIKTLHPKIHGALLALRDDPEHLAAMKAHDIQPIDLVCVNLYPFAKTIEKPGVSFDEAIENIDIGGPSMIRSAAKNHRYVLVVTSPLRYEKVLGDLRQHGGSSCGKHRLKQAQSAFAQTAEYDGLIAKYLAKVLTPEVPKESDPPVPYGGPARFLSEPSEGGIATAAEIFPDESNRIRPLRSTLVQRLMNPDSSFAAFLTDLVTAQAVSVAGTEAAAFVVGHGESKLASHPIVHIRPDQSDAAVRAAAMEAFQSIIRPCVEQGKDGAIEVGPPDRENRPQYCLVTLLRNGENIAAASAIIVRCDDLNQARHRLLTVQLVASYFELYTLRNPSAIEPVEPGLLARSLTLNLHKQQDLRYGENPHQKAALYVDRQPQEASVAYARQLHGKELSYINLLDADGALSVVKEFSTPAACIVKHTTPCGCATAADLPTAFRRAFDGDPLAAFGGIVALNQKVELDTAQAITGIDKLLEVIVAPSFSEEALHLLRDRWKNVRLLEVGPVGPFDSAELHLHKIVGGYLVQQRDLTGLNESDWKVVSRRAPSPGELDDLRFAWLVCKHVKSNAVVVARDQMLLGAGAGQMDRPSAARLAITKAGDRGQGAVAASDAFFPFPDAPELLLNAGVTAIIQPGGSLRDKDTIDLVDTRGSAMVFTGQRHFKH